MRVLTLSLPVLGLTLGLFASAATGAAPAKPGAPAKPAPAMPADDKAALAEVLAHVKTAGREQAFLDFTARRPPFFDASRSRYVICVDAKLVVVAHGGFATYVGSGAFFRNASGVTMAPAIWAAATKGDGTLRYAIRSDETNNQLEKKVGTFQRVKNDVCGVVARATD